MPEVTEPAQEQLDLAEFAAALVSEVRSGIRATSAGTGAGMAVVAATIRVGQPRAPDDDGTPPDAHDVAVRPSPIVLRPRAAAAGWEFELTLDVDELGRDVGSGDPADEDRPAAASPSAEPLWRPRPLTDLKGVDEVRARVLAEEGVRRIGDLLDLDEAGIAGIVTRQRSHLYLDHWVKATLLRTPAPLLAPSRADGHRLATLSARPPTALRELIGPEVCSRSAARQLFDLLAAWGTALDRRVMATVTLGHLRRATRTGT